MPAFDDITVGKTPAESTDIQQIIDALTARRNTPLSTLINDAVAPNLTLRNSDAGGRTLFIYSPDGTTLWLGVDATGVKVSKDGGPAVAPVTEIGPAADAAAAGDHVHGAGGYSSSGATTLELLYASTWITRNTNYAVAAGILFVFCTSGITVTLPDAAATNRPITVVAITGTTTVASAGGSVIGGSTNLSTGAIMDGVVSPGDAIPYKSDGTNWRALA